jgi:hypothetical protein
LPNLENFQKKVYQGTFNKTGKRPPRNQRKYLQGHAARKTRLSAWRSGNVHHAGSSKSLESVRSRHPSPENSSGKKCQSTKKMKFPAPGSPASGRDWLRSGNFHALRLSRAAKHSSGKKRKDWGLLFSAKNAR